MRSAVILLVVSLAALVGPTRLPVRAQSDAKPPAFEVASVKVNHSASDVSVNSGATPGRFTITNVPLRFIMLYAFHLLDHQLVATPEWASSTSYDINATYPPGITPSEDDARVMVQTLLQDRFGLVFHHETRELPAYELTLARKDGRLGSQLVRSDVDCVQWHADGRPLAGAGGPSRVAPGGKRPACSLAASRRFITAGTAPIKDLAVALQGLLGRVVIDHTGLAGAFDIDLQWTSSVETSTTATTASSAPDDGASIFTSLQEQLGLKLEATRAPFDVVVVDRVEPPTAD